MSDEISEIRARINIVDLVEAHGIQLRRTGKNYIGLCPFHVDHKPSFTVNPSFGSYKCFACGEAGDIFKWVMKTQNLEFVEALRLLADKAGVTLSRQSKPTSEGVEKRASNAAAMELALRFFQSQFKACEPVKQYCLRREISAETILEWELGYAPANGEALVAHLKKSGVALAAAKELFLVDGSPENGYGDKFKDRLIFPIRDERGVLVAFGGRIMGDGVPKYINSSDTPLYRKGRVLYGLHQSRNFLMKERRAILVEGYLDVIACHAAGLKGASASLGTALAEDQAKLLKRWTDLVTILYDGDEAGQKASERAAAVLGEQGIPVRVAILPPGEDPDTILKRSGPGELQKIVEQAISPLEFRISRLEASKPPSDEQFWLELAQLMSEANSELVLAQLVERFAPKYPGLRDVVAARKALRADVQKLRKKPLRSSPTNANKVRLRVETGLHSSEQSILQAYLAGLQRARLHELFGRADFFLTDRADQLGTALREQFGEHPPEGEPKLWLHELDEATAASLENLATDRFGELSEEFLSDAVAILEKHQQDRALKRLETDGGRLEMAQARLRQLKPDARDMTAEKP